MILECYKNILNQIYNYKKSNKLHHAIILNLENNILIDNFINSISSIIIDKNIENYKESAYINVANIENGEIKLSEIKKAIKSTELKGYSNFAKLIIIKDIDLLNITASNALLKTLEEPSENTYFLMLTNNKYNNIISTIKSRSILYNIKLTDLDRNIYLKETFNMNENSISLAKKVSRNDLDIITRIKTDTKFWKTRNSVIKTLLSKYTIYELFKETSSNYPYILYWLNSFIIDMYLYKSNINDEQFANYDKLGIIKHLTNYFSIDDIYFLYKKSLDAKNIFEKYKTVDKQLVLESLLLNFKIKGNIL